MDYDLFLPMGTGGAPFSERKWRRTRQRRRASSQGSRTPQARTPDPGTHSGGKEAGTKDVSVKRRSRASFAEMKGFFRSLVWGSGGGGGGGGGGESKSPSHANPTAQVRAEPRNYADVQPSPRAARFLSSPPPPGKVDTPYGRGRVLGRRWDNIVEVALDGFHATMYIHESRTDPTEPSASTWVHTRYGEGEIVGGNASGMVAVALSFGPVTAFMHGSLCYTKRGPSQPCIVHRGISVAERRLEDLLKPEVVPSTRRPRVQEILSGKGIVESLNDFIAGATDLSTSPALKLAMIRKGLLLKKRALAALGRRETYESIQSTVSGVSNLLTSLRSSLEDLDQGSDVRIPEIIPPAVQSKKGKKAPADSATLKPSTLEPSSAPVASKAPSLAQSLLDGLSKELSNQDGLLNRCATQMLHRVGVSTNTITEVENDAEHKRRPSLLAELTARGVSALTGSTGVQDKTERPAGDAKRPQNAMARLNIDLLSATSGALGSLALSSYGMRVSGDGKTDAGRVVELIRKKLLSMAGTAAADFQQSEAGGVLASGLALLADRKRYAAWVQQSSEHLARRVGEIRQVGRGFIDKVRTHVATFLTEHLPKLKLPPIRGTDKQRNFWYHVRNLSLDAFTIDPKNVRARFRGRELEVRVRGARCSIRDLHWELKQLRWPNVSASGEADASVTGIRVTFRLGLQGDEGETAGGVGSPRALFALREKRIGIGKILVSIAMAGKFTSWVANTAVWAFSDILKRYTVQRINEALDKHVGGLVEKLNAFGGRDNTLLRTLLTYATAGGPAEKADEEEWSDDDDTKHSAGAKDVFDEDFLLAF